MKYLDTGYTNGVIAVREKYLLKDKIFRFCELPAEEAFRLLTESGFGAGGETPSSVYEYENLITTEESRTDEFIREYAPSNTEKAYLLSPRDFHNAKALVKASYLGVNAERMLASEGMEEISLLANCVEKREFSEIKNSVLAKACQEAVELLEKDPSGAKVGGIFDKACYQYLFKITKGRPALQKMTKAKADMQNILIAFRCADAKTAKEQYLPEGKLKYSLLESLFLQDKEKIKSAFLKTGYWVFVETCLEAKEKGLPTTEAERKFGGYEVGYFEMRKFDLQKNEPFLYYVYRKRLECANVRVIFACLLSGQEEREIKKRLRTV